MKNIILIISIFLGSITFTFGQYLEASSDVLEVNTSENVKLLASVKWVSSYKKALKKALKENKPLLVYFTGSDWCKPCKILKEELFETRAFKKFSKKEIILYKADFPYDQKLISSTQRRANYKLSSKFYVESYPTLIMLDSYGFEMGRKEGYYLTNSYFEFIKEIVENYK